MCGILVWLSHERRAIKPSRKPQTWGDMGKPNMNTAREYEITMLEIAMFDHACGRMSAKQLKLVFDRLGWRVDLRMWLNNTLEAFAPDGAAYVLTC